jgi:hypothetical protein
MESNNIVVMNFLKKFSARVLSGPFKAAGGDNPEIFLSDPSKMVVQAG